MGKKEKKGASAADKYRKQQRKKELQRVFNYIYSFF